MEVRAVWTVLGVLFFLISLVTGFYPEYYVEDLCKMGNETVIYETSMAAPAGTLKATSQPPYNPSKNCTIIIKPPPGRGVVLSVRKIDMREYRFVCQDYIKVFHSDFFTSPTVLCRFKFDLKEKLSFYTKGPMTLLYHVGPGLYPRFTYEEGFMLTFTTVSEDIQDCVSDDTYMCGNGRCIAKSMTCDGRNNCGDGSDEDRALCDSTFFYYLHMTDIVYIVVFSILIMSIILTCLLVVSRRRHRSTDSDLSSDNDEPTARLTPFQAVHPRGFAISQNPAGPRAVYAHHAKVVHADGGFANPCFPNGMPPPPPPYSQ